MRVLVTGANGYIGKHVVSELVEEGYEVIANDVVFRGTLPRVNCIEKDIFSGKETLYSELGSPDVIIHLAWQDGFVHNSPAHMLNLSKHVQFLCDMMRMGCKNIAVMGTMHEIGYWEGSIDENTPCNPMSQYGIAKNALRQAMLLFTKEFEANLFWLRAYYIYGDDLRGNSIFSKIAQMVEQGSKEFPFTTGKNLYDFISVEDLAMQIVTASTQDRVTGIINVCSGTPVSLAEQVEKYIADRGYDIKLKYGAYPDREYDSSGIWGDNTKIQEILKHYSK